MLKQRVITAIVLIIVVSSILFFASESLFIGFVGFVLVIAGWEWANLCHLKQRWQQYLYASSLIPLGLLVWYVLDNAYFPFLTLQSVLVCAVFWWAIALLWIQGYPSSEIFWRSSSVRMLIGLAVLLPAWLGLSLLRTMPSGHMLVLSVVLVVAVADSGAYFVGKAFGKRKLAPNVSPGKSWEGVIGGVCAVALLTVVFFGFRQDGDLLTLLAITLPTAMVSVIGDLLESMLKRHRGIKDSSQLLPGHGGVLDRVDGLLAAVPVFSLAVLTSGWQW